MELFFHRAPDGYEYVIDDFNNTTKRIWILNRSREFIYREGAGPPRSVWGFYKPKSKKFYSPINHKKVGKEVDLKEIKNVKLMKFIQLEVRLLLLH